jgi:hypothetical protein
VPAAAYPWVTLVGLGGVLTGIAWDAILHARDPLRSGHEGLFAVSNPGHLVIGFGVAIAVAAQIGALMSRMATLRSRLVLTALSVGVLAAVGGACLWSWSVQVGQARATDRLVIETRTGIARYRNPALALADGYLPATPLSGPISEWVNPGYVRAGRILDTRRPERLMYFSSAHGLTLAGAMFLLPGATSPAAPVAALAHWHRHYDMCYLPSGAIAGSNSYGFACPAGSSVHPTPFMLHVWIVGNPKDAFADDLPLPTIMGIIGNA